MLHLCSKYIRNCLNSKGHCLSVEGEFQSVYKAFKLELQIPYSQKNGSVCFHVQ